MTLNIRLPFLALFLILAMPLIAFGTATTHTGTDYTSGGTNCTDCHTGNGDSNAPQIDLSVISHPYGPGTPMQGLLVLGDTVEGKSAACITCHQVRTEGDNTRENRPPLTLDNVSCTKCHGTTTTVSTTGSIIATSNILTVANATGLRVGESISVAGAGSSADLVTSVIAILGNDVLLTDAASTAVSDADVIQTYNVGPNASGKTIVGTAGSISAASNILTVTSAKGLLIGQRISVAGAGSFGGALNTYVSGISGTDITLLAPSPFSVTATDATQIYGGAPAMAADQMAVYAVNIHALSASAPEVGSTPLTISGYTVTFTDASTDSAAVSVNWGDGTVSAGTSGNHFEHTYIAGAVYNITHTASLNNNFATESLKATVPSESAAASGGAVGVQVNDYNAAGLADVSLYLKQNGLTKKLGATDSTGAFTFQDVPSGTYDLIAYEYGKELKMTAGDCNAVEGTITVNAATPEPTCTFTQTQTKFALTVNAPAAYVITVKQSGVTKGIQKVDGVFGVNPDGSVLFGNLASGTYSVSGYYFEFDGTNYIQHSCSATAIFPGTGDQTVDCL